MPSSVRLVRLVLGSFTATAFVVLAGCAPRARETAAATTPEGGAAAEPSDKNTPVERPFAGSPAEATQLIGAVIDQNEPAVNRCVREHRARKKMPRERVELSVGIDQEGKLLGITMKKNPDAELTTCVQEVLRGAPFPRSHAGVITVTKSYEEILQ